MKFTWRTNEKAIATPELKLTGFDFVPREYFLGMRLRGDDFSRTKSIKKVMRSALTKNWYNG